MWFISLLCIYKESDIVPNNITVAASVVDFIKLSLRQMLSQYVLHNPFWQTASIIIVAAVVLKRWKSKVRLRSSLV